MRIETIVCGPASVNTYLLINDETKESIIIDPGDHEPVENVVEKQNLVPRAVLLTHGHFDHMIGCAKTADKYSIPVYIHKKDSGMLTEPDRYVSPFYLPFHIDPVQDSNHLEDNDTLEIAGFRIRVLYTPGHTPGGVCYALDDEKLVFCGDTLFYQSVGRTDFAYSNSALMFAAIRKKILPLPDDYALLPGHGPRTSVGCEKKQNPYISVMQ